MLFGKGQTSVVLVHVLFSKCSQCLSEGSKHTKYFAIIKQTCQEESDYVPLLCCLRATWSVDGCCLGLDTTLLCRPSLTDSVSQTRVINSHWWQVTSDAVKWGVAFLDKCTATFCLEIQGGLKLMELKQILGILLLWIFKLQDFYFSLIFAFQSFILNREHSIQICRNRSCGWEFLETE